MSSTSSWLRRAGHALATRLDRMRHTFENLREQLRDAIAQQIGQTVAVTVREAVEHLLDETPVGHEPPSYRPYASTSRSPMWEEPDPWAEPSARWEERPPDTYPDAVESAPAVEPVRVNLNHAVLVGCEAAAWWLRLRWGRLPLVAAMVLGSLAAVVTMVGGPLGAAGFAVVGSAVSLLALARRSRLDLPTESLAHAP